MEQKKAYFTKCSIFLLKALYTCFLSHLTDSNEVAGGCLVLYSPQENKAQLECKGTSIHAMSTKMQTQEETTDKAT
ncbi:hypothetical protein CTI12_AA466050 [Artemisia annua]|uniref:Uncharacterized protein n=1 Tax=Artemisia annua TaxID=35608 RepID=A0A2U1LQ69_ARTAN|nr:hypothetical protein CTI12_AA466050 [Artemisia annua]